MNLIYVADPMCSWCYGFGRPLGALLTDAGELAPLHLTVLMGGLRPFTTEPLPAGRAEDVISHWHHVAEASGLPFAQAPHTALHEPGFVYDTEPPCRAVVVVREQWPEKVWTYLEAIQRAFYAEARNITRSEVLAAIAGDVGLPRDEFQTALDTDTARAATLRDFDQSQTWGITGFPALIADHGGQLHMVARGYTPLDTLRERLTSLQAGATA
jgi:putative protein-disulfide isomerase